MKKRFNQESQFHKEQWFLDTNAKRKTLEVLKCILNDVNATGDMDNVAAGLYDLLQKEMMDSSTGICGEADNDRWEAVPDTTIGLVIVRSGCVVRGFTTTLSYAKK